VAICEGLHAELRDAGSDIGVTVVCPSYVPTKIRGSRRNSPPDLRTKAEHSGFYEAARDPTGLLSVSPEKVAVQIIHAV
jgi:hypothetical protein